MMKFVVVVLLLLGQVACTQEKKELSWGERKYSMFIHFGLYSELGGVWKGEEVRNGYSEQIQSFAKIPREEYMAVAKEFNPERWDAAEVVSLAKAAGMKSIVFTSKHHDGFCMYHTKYTDYNVVDATPFKRDPMKELADECAKQGMNFGVYFSLIDWNFPGNIITPHNADAVSAEHHRYNMKQVEEILTNYGPVSELWFDMGSLSGEQSKELYDLVHRLQPQCMVSGRLGNDRGDFAVMADNVYPDYEIGTPWQTAASFFKETWSYRSWQDRGDETVKVDEKLRDLMRVVSAGGNFLLNIGPKGDGSIVDFEKNVLLEMGKWIDRYAEGIYATQANPFGHRMSWGDITCKGNNIYLFVWDMPANRELLLPGLQGELKACSLLADGRDLSSSRDGLTVKLTVPENVKVDHGMIVIKLEFANGFQVIPDQLLERETNLSFDNTHPVFAYSSMDYYSSFKSIVGFHWYLGVEANAVQPVLYYTADNAGEVIRLTVDGNGRDVKLENGKACPLTTDVKAVKWGETRLFGPYEDLFREDTQVEGEGEVMKDIEWGKKVTIPVGNKNIIHVAHEITSDKEQNVLVELGVADGFRVTLNDSVLLTRSYVGGIAKKPIIVKLHLKEGKNQLLVTLYNRYGKSLEYMINPEVEQVEYALELPEFVLRQGNAHDVQLRLAQPVNRNSDIGLRNLRMELNYR